MWSKRQAFYLLFIALIFSMSFVVFQPTIRFDYDFEQFFPQDDEDLGFYQNYAQLFGEDNDYLLMAFENQGKKLWEPDFLNEFKLLQGKIQLLENVDTTLSILDLKQPRISPFGIRFQPVLLLDEDSVLVNRFNAQLEGKFISKDGKSLLLLVQNRDNLTKDEGDALYGQILDEISNSNLSLRAVAGKIQTQRDFVDLMQAEFSFFLGLSLLVMLLMLIVLFRSWWGVAIPIIVLGVGVAWAFGVILWLGNPLALMSVMQPTLFLIVGLGALVHLLSHLRQKLEKGYSKDYCIDQTFRQLLIPIGLTMMTTAFGFLSLWFTSVPALKDFGLTTGIGILVMFFAVVLLTPGLLFLIKIPELERSRNTSKNWVLNRLFVALLKRRTLVIWVFVGISVLSLVLGSQVRINGFLLDNLPSNHPIREDFEYFDQQFGGSNPLEIAILTPSEELNIFDYEVLEQIQKIENKLQDYFSGVSLISPLTVAEVLNQAQNQGNSEAFQFPSKGQYLRMKRILDTNPQQFLPAVYNSENRIARISGRLPDLGSFKMGEIRRDFFEFVKEEIDPELLKVKWTGTSYLIDRGHESVTLEMARGLGVAFLLVGVIAGILFRSWRISFILLIPNIIPLLMMLAVMNLMGIELKLTTAILFSVAFGIAVDDSIHFMARLRTELSSGKTFFYALKRTYLETGKALVLTTLILVLGFSLFLFSDFGVTFYTGLLIALALIFALSADMLFLPLFLIPLKKVWESKVKKLNL
ncbi:efflux RND transporter permease subunit [Algoriphagus limi]|uniref:MMPL family transporter n=1 Tax=Algoriphagus limi TaxID=2975273 RepID=A0ABT2G113_9BACT|nr:MMPL family transporter [Algoriphagus limi]MCS5488951.1 MMPL family transporter [Algoriphagus limi]